MSPTAVAEVEAQKKRVYMELFIQSPVFVSFFLVIENMVEKVTSFQTGGASWFIDLTTADAFYILPLLAAISCWITVEVKTLLLIVSVAMSPFGFLCPYCILCSSVYHAIFTLFPSGFHFPSDFDTVN
ncbi:unnamed protein product [Lactuca virosa]|uniref:Uncharacterized protein n=1 Tax=Lactuca virosa TaxID=75947 RepID=A0AAU9MHU8_9ASTR|nr:unnamed protein product [Lactuca virosa]